MSELSQLFDYYGRAARLYPALIVLGPIFPLLVVGSPMLMQNLAQSAALGVCVLATLYFLSSFARSRGKTEELRLIQAWGGLTTTVVLRHSDSFIEKQTKQRYHSALQGICPDLHFPTATDEAANPSAADEAYRSATRRLIELRRGPSWQLLLNENAAYGFRRNMLGLKAIGLSLSLLLAALTLGYWWLESGSPQTAQAILAVLVTWPLPILAVCFDLTAACAWVLIVTRRWVHQASYDYAIALFRTLEFA